MKMPKLLLDRLPADFHARLENWGDVMRSGNVTYAISPTYEICRMLAKRAGQGEWGGEEEPPERDEQDAQFIEAAWRNSVYRMPHEHRSLLRAHYVAKAYWKGTCRALSIRPREYDGLLVRAVGNFEDFVARYAAIVHNQRQDRLTTV